jgi:hypothetical protein
MTTSRRFSLRFADAALERRFVEESAAADRPFLRGAFAWGLVAWPLIGIVGIGAGVQPIRVIIAIAMVAAPPVHAAGFVLTTRWRSPIGPQVLGAMINMLAGAAMLALSRGAGVFERYGAVWVMVLLAFVLVLRHRFKTALIASLTYVVGYFGLALSYPFRAIAVDVTSVLMVWPIVMVVVYLVEKSGRERFMQRLTIEEQRSQLEAQQSALAEERAKSERLLKLELGHQVAERSRDLGAALARIDKAIVVGAPRPGERFDTRYRVVRELGAGGMGAVFEVERVTDAQRLALKVVTGQVSGQSAARFAREAEIGAKVHHPNLVSIVDVGISDGGAPFLVMELVHGRSLEGHRSDFGDHEWALPILGQIAEGLCALHDARVVHRDLKPANVLLATDGDARRVKISDFGISRVGIADGAVDAEGATEEAAPKKQADLTGTGAMLGTPLYMAPEAARGGRAVGAAADMFAFGILAYEMLTARAPFTMPPILLAMTGQQVPIPSTGSLPVQLGELVLACLASDPTKRPSARDARNALVRPVA